MKLGNKQFVWLLSLVTVVACLGIIGYRFQLSKPPEAIDFTYIKTTIPEEDSRNNNNNNTATTAKEEDYAAENIEVTLFQFDPNTASKDDFVKLGLKPKVAQTIINYREKGGTFYKPEDFKRIYTLQASDYQRLLPFIKIVKIADDGSKFGQEKYTKEAYQPKTNHPIDINEASVEEWQKQKGIGAGFANRIVTFRDKLGGFRTIEQLKEVYGLPDSTYQNLLPFIKINTQNIKRFSLNSITELELAQHPYVGPKMAANIIKLRTDLGRYSKIEDLKMVPLINEEKYRKIAQYFKVD